jgi:hypothetical protein
MNGAAGVTFSWTSASHVQSSDHLGRNVLSSAMKMPRPSPPARARGMLTSWPTAAAATATTTRLKKSAAASWLKRGAMSTPASPAKNDDSAHANAETRSAAIPFSSVIRGLSTTARIRRPIAEYRNSAPRATTATTPTTIWASSSRLNE